MSLNKKEVTPLYQCGDIVMVDNGAVLTIKHAYVEEGGYGKAGAYEPYINYSTVEGAIISENFILGRIGVDDKVEDKQQEDHHDKHYQEAVVEPIKVMQKLFTREEYIGFLKGNILKYRLRMGHKDDIQTEMDKIRVYEKWLTEATKN